MNRTLMSKSSGWVVALLSLGALQLSAATADSLIKGTPFAPRSGSSDKVHFI